MDIGCDSSGAMNARVSYDENDNPISCIHRKNVHNRRLVNPESSNNCSGKLPDSLIFHNQICVRFPGIVGMVPVSLGSKPSPDNQMERKFVNTRIPFGKLPSRLFVSVSWNRKTLVDIWHIRVQTKDHLPKTSLAYITYLVRSRRWNHSRIRFQTTFWPLPHSANYFRTTIQSFVSNCLHWSKSTVQLDNIVRQTSISSPLYRR